MEGLGPVSHRVLRLTAHEFVCVLRYRGRQVWLALGIR